MLEERAPIVTTVSQNAVEDKLDPDAFPLITGADAPVGGAHAARLAFRPSP